MILERATGMPYERFVDERRVAAGGRGPRTSCSSTGARACRRRIAAGARRRATCCASLSLLGSDGMISGTRVLPAGWAREMARPSRVSAGTGMQVNAA